MKLFPDDTLFSTVYDPNISASQLKGDLKNIPHCAYKLKIPVNLDLSKQAQDVVFSRKAVKISHQSVSLLMLCQLLAQRGRGTLVCILVKN